MKKYLFMALAAFAFVSCSNDFDANEGAATAAKGNRIEYNVYTGAASRGTIIADFDAFKDGENGYRVWANIYKKNPNDTLIFVEDNNVWNKTNGSWDIGANASKVWPDSALNFYFYAPHTALTLTDADKKKAEYIYSQPEGPANQKDILYGAPVLNKKSGMGAVNVQLTHVMSHIAIKAMAGTNVPGGGLVISSIALKGQFATSGTMDFKAAQADNFWKNTVTQDTVYRPGTVNSSVSSKTVFNNVLQNGQDMFIIPCTVPALTIEVNFTSDGKNWTKEYTVNNQVFAIGQSYEIRLTLDVDLITYTIENIGFWTTGGTVAPTEAP
jgi:hypothetical protein